MSDSCDCKHRNRPAGFLPGWLLLPVKVIVALALLPLWVAFWGTVVAVIGWLVFTIVSIFLEIFRNPL